MHLVVPIGFTLLLICAVGDFFYRNHAQLQQEIVKYMDSAPTKTAWQQGKPNR